MTDGEDRVEAEDVGLQARFTTLGVRIQSVTMGRGPTASTEAMCDLAARLWAAAPPVASPGRRVRLDERFSAG